MDRCSFAIFPSAFVSAFTPNCTQWWSNTSRLFSRLRGCALVLALLAAVLFCWTSAWAQSAHLMGIALGRGLATPITGAYSFASDSAGNIYVADEPNLRIVIIPPGDLACATSCTVVALTNLVGGEHPTRLTVDAVGNIYVATQDMASNFGHIYYLAKNSPGNYTQSVFYSV